MMGRDRRNGRANIKARVGIATAVLVGGGAIGIAVAASGGHGASPAASAGYNSSFFTRTSTNSWNQLNSAMNTWNWNRTSAYNTLASMTGQRTYMQTMRHGKMLAIQRGMVVLATKKFIVLQSANGSLHLWLTSGNTRFQNVANTMAGTAALTGSSTATVAAMQQNNIIPATELLAGSPLTVAQALTPSTVPQTITVNVTGTNLTVTITITRTTAAVSSTATVPWNGMPVWSPTTMTQNAMAPVAMTNTAMVARGDLATIAGFRSHNLLHAQIVLFQPMTTGMVGGVTGVTPTATPTATPTVHATTPTPTVTSTAGSSGVHY